jgi:hypothetical protein
MVLKIDHSADKLDPQFKVLDEPIGKGVRRIFLGSFHNQHSPNGIENSLEQESHHDR